ncbi:glycosyltransferase family 2 protein [candidate division KSB1 bacterium]
MKSPNLDIPLSVIIVSYNTKDIIQECLTSLFANGLNGMEIIVVDNNSSDSTLEMIKTGFSDVIVISNPDNRGFAAANNQGIEISLGKYILLLNPDTIVKGECLMKCYKYMENHVETGILGCRILNPDSTVQPSVRDFHGFWNSIFESFFLTKIFGKIKLFGKYHGTCYNYDKNIDANVLLGAFLFIRKELIEQIGPLDERFFIYSEETDLCYRAKKTGWKNVFYPGAEIIHIHGESTSNIKIQAFLHLHNSLNKYLRKHKWYLISLICRIVLFFGVTVRMIAWFIFSIITLDKQRYDKFRVYLSTFLWYIKLRKIKIT